jgi:multiple sugar transport system substrate-binding protein
MYKHTIPKYCLLLLLTGVLTLAMSCQNKGDKRALTLAWYVFDEPSGAFRDAAEHCSQMSAGHYAIVLTPLPTDADQQREQLVRRLAAVDTDIDIVGMDVIWTAEFAEAGWILPLPALSSGRVAMGRLPTSVETVRYKNRLWGIPFTSNAQLLWYRNDRVSNLPQSWDELIEKAETMGNSGNIQVQGQRYEGLTAFFISLLASAGGSVLDESGGTVSLEAAPTLKPFRL